MLSSSRVTQTESKEDEPLERRWPMDFEETVRLRQKESQNSFGNLSSGALTPDSRSGTLLSKTASFYNPSPQLIGVSPALRPMGSTGSADGDKASKASKASPSGGKSWKGGFSLRSKKSLKLPKRS